MEKNKLIPKNPATLENYPALPILKGDEVAERVHQAKQASRAWANLSFKERGRYLLKAREYLLDHLDEIARTISEDNGKPLVESLTSDILTVCDSFTYYSKHAEKILKDEKLNIGIMGWLGRSSKIHYQPLGVVAIISPWNFPFSIPMTGTIMALIAGNTVLLKPADATPRVGFKIEEIFKAAGLPKGVFTHLPGGADVGEALVTSPIDKVVFTGSVRVGKRIMELCAQNLTPCTLELGGKDAMIVCEDAPLENAAKAAVWGAFTNCGQVCASVERVYVDEKIADRFIEKVVEKTRQLRVGVSVESESDLGPLTTEAQLKIVEKQVEEAKQKGAKILTGGKRPDHLKGYFYEPTVLSEVDHSFSCVRDETFGPLLPIMTFKTEEEAIKLANNSIYGLCASVWTKDLNRGKKLARQIQAGTIAINECTYTFAIPQTPWGGLKQSGYGRTHGKMGLHELVQAQHIHQNRFGFIQDFWWFGYDLSLYQRLKKLCRLYSGGIWEKCQAVVQILLETRRKKY